MIDSYYQYIQKTEKWQTRKYDKTTPITKGFSHVQRAN